MPVAAAASIVAQARSPDAGVRALRAASLLVLVGLIGLGLAWELWLAPTGQRTLAVKVLPLVLCVPGVLRHRMYTFRWMSLLIWLYVIEGSVRATTETGLSAWLAGGQTLLCLLLFAACALYIRRRLGAPRAGLTPIPPPEGVKELGSGPSLPERHPVPGVAQRP